MLLALLACLALTLVPAATASEMGQAAASQVSLTSYQDFLDNWLYAHGADNRGPSGAAHDLARDNIILLFQSFGLQVAVEPFSWEGGTYENVVATKWGSLDPSREHVLGAHYDSANTPGADDDASGVALVLEAARVLSQFDTEYTIRFVAFDLKEPGLLGSQAYVTAHAGDNVLGMISADMVAYDPGTNQALIQGPPFAGTIKQDLSAALALYGGLSAVLQGDSLPSDHQRFVSAGIPACLLAERQAASNPYVHTQADTVDTPGYINYPFAVKMTRGAVGFLADHAGASGLRFVYPSGRPTWLDPAGGTRLRVEVEAAGLTPQPGTGVLHYNTGGGWQSAPMTVVSPNVYDAVFPAAPCGTTVSYYASAQAVGGTTYSDPRIAPTATYSALAGVGVDVIFEDAFEANLGWTVGDTGDNATTGTWTRNVPQQTIAQPGADHTPPPGTMCWVTDYRAGSSDGTYDVDGGKTTLKSPTLNLAGLSGAMISYWRWYSNSEGANPNADTFVVDISNNNGGSWTNVETVGPSGPGTFGGWFYHEFRVADFVTPTAQIKLRFIAQDLGAASLVEAAIDDFRAVSYDCDGNCAGAADGDLNGDGAVDGRDVQSFVEAVVQGPSAWALCHGDFTGDGLLDPSDIPGFVAALLAQ